MNRKWCFGRFYSYKRCRNCKAFNDCTYKIIYNALMNQSKWDKFIMWLLSKR